MSDIIVKDEKGREIIRIGDNGRMAFARFPDISVKTRECIVSLYGEVSGNDPQKIIDFLNYKGDDNEFCV